MNYKLIRCKRKSISICISDDNVITVRCPYSMSEARIKEFVDSKKNWIENVIKQNSERCRIYKGVLEYREVYINGNKVPIIYTNRNYISDSAVYVKDKSCIKKLFIKTFTGDLCAMAVDISKELNMTVSDFSVKAYKSRWGCCNRDGSIVLNYLLAMLPVELQRYVIIHELCHRIYFNHSKAFWNLVGLFEPRYKALRNRLKAFNFLTNLY